VHFCCVFLFSDDCLLNCCLQERDVVPAGAMLCVSGSAAAAAAESTRQTTVVSNFNFFSFLAQTILLLLVYAVFK